MTEADRAWVDRVQLALMPLWRLVVCPGRPLAGSVGWRVYCAAMRSHRWLWVRGVKL